MLSSNSTPIPSPNISTTTPTSNLTSFQNGSSTFSSSSSSSSTSKHLNCVVRTRLPNPYSSECYLHVYSLTSPTLTPSSFSSSSSCFFNPTHHQPSLAYVFGSSIRSTSLDAMQTTSTDFSSPSTNSSSPSPSSMLTSTSKLQTSTPPPSSLLSSNTYQRFIHGASLPPSYTPPTSMHLDSFSPSSFHSYDATMTSIPPPSLSSSNSLYSFSHPLHASMTSPTLPSNPSSSSTTTTTPTTSTPTSGSVKTSSTSKAPLVRVHSQCFTGETLGSLRCDCGSQLNEAMQLMAQEQCGVLIYLCQEGRGIGLVDKLKAYNLQDLGYSTVTANELLHHPIDLRSYEVAAWILKDLNIHRIRLLTNNPEKVHQLQSHGIQVMERIGMIPPPWKPSFVHRSNTMNNASLTSSISTPMSTTTTSCSSCSSCTSSTVTSASFLSSLVSSTHSRMQGNEPRDQDNEKAHDMETSLAKNEPLHWHQDQLKEMEPYLLAKVKQMDHLIELPPHLQSAS